jgi:hypothetical protein
VSTRDERLLVTQRPLTVVVELGLQPLQVIEVLVALGLGIGQTRAEIAFSLDDDLRLRLPCIRGGTLGGRLPMQSAGRTPLLGHDFFAASSSSMTS